MNENLEKLLTTRFSEFFDRRAYPGCGDGWFRIIWNICNQVEVHLRSLESQNQWYHSELTKLNQGVGPFAGMDESQKALEKNKLLSAITTIPLFKIAQIKEKFGTLRFYYDGGNSTIDGIVQFGEALSEQTCEECGQPASLRHGSWLKTLCDEHAKQRNCFRTPVLEPGSTVYAVRKNSRAVYQVLEVHSSHRVRAKRELLRKHPLDEHELKYDDPVTLELIQHGDIAMWIEV